MIALAHAVNTVPAGAWGVGVSGGADSVALLSLLRDRSDLILHVIHLNHETRGVDSDGDAQFVAQLAATYGLPRTIARLSDVYLDSSESNPSARYRAARLELFTSVVHRHALRGVILAHHADDQAETILQRLMRGHAPTALAGIRPQSSIGDLLVLHPLLQVFRRDLRQYLTSRDIAWREDVTNASPLYLRNRLRRLLKLHAPLTPALLALGNACSHWNAWLENTSPHLPARFPVSTLHDLPTPLALHAARRWLMERNVAEDCGHEVVQRLLTMAQDAASPSKQIFPNALTVRRRQSMIFIDPVT